MRICYIFSAHRQQEGDHNDYLLCSAARPPAAEVFPWRLSTPPLPVWPRPQPRTHAFGPAPAPPPGPGRENDREGRRESDVRGGNDSDPKGCVEKQ